jgi:SAM-dependent methyltransferase
MPLSPKEHWNKVYTKNSNTALGWYEAEASQSIQLIERCDISKQSPIVDIGSGASILIPKLLELGYTNVSPIDISDVALKKAKALLSKERSEVPHWTVADITNPNTLLELSNVALWHDRAVFHFLDEAEHRRNYHSLLHRIVRSGGFVIIAAFALDGAAKCSGLPVQRYSVETLSDFLGDGFKLIEGFDYTYHMPSGDTRPYIYTRFQKV